MVEITFELSIGNYFEEIYNFLKLEIFMEINKLFIIF